MEEGRFYCDGKKGICLSNELCDDNCKHYTGTGGKYVQGNQTHFDQIKSMDIDKLAEFLMEWAVKFATGKAPFDVKQWLESEVKEPGGGNE